MIFIKEQHELERIKPILLSKKNWAFDVETTGLDPHRDKVIMAQIGRKEEAFVIDARRVDLRVLKESFFENNEIVKVGHNLKFDYKMMRGTFDIHLENLQDTFLAEKVMSAGLVHYLSKDHKFDKVAKKRCNIDIEEKEVMQKSFINHVGDFSQAQIEYGASDVIHPIPVLAVQTTLMKEQGLLNTFHLECGVCPAFGDMEFEGMMLDTDKWLAVLEDNRIQAFALERKMNVLALEVLGGNLFGEVDINYASPKQVLNLLQKMGIKVTVWDRDLRREVTKLIDKTNDDFLKRIHDNQLVEYLRDWRSFKTLINNFGESYIKAVHTKTGCIHPNLWQLGAGTGRPTSGDSDVNPLNVPKDNRYRSCFICDEDEIVESDDFSGCESRILAHISGDKELIGIFNRGEDIHCAVASALYGVTVTKKENKHLRAPAKALNFGRLAC